MGVIEQVLRIGDGRKRQTMLFKYRRQLGGAAFQQTLAQQGNQPAARQHPVVVAGKPGIGKQVCKTKSVAKHPPLGVAHHGQKDLRAVFHFEHVVNAPRRNFLWHGCGGFAGDGELQHVLGHQKNIVFKQRRLHLLAFAGLLALHQGGHRPHGAKQAAHDVVDAAACAQWVTGAPGHVGQAPHHLHHLVQRGAVVVGAG